MSTVVDKPVSKVLHAVSQPYDIQGHSGEHNRPASVSVFIPRMQGWRDVDEASDQALYGPKRAGKKHYHMASVQPPVGDGAQMMKPEKYND